MKKTPFIILTLALTLTACAPTATATPAPPKATNAPLSTETPIPSPTPLPLTWVSAENGEGIELPADLFDLVKDRNPLLSAEGAQILNAKTNEVLLEKRDGAWQESLLTLAINEYGMPEEMAQQLEGLDVSFNEDVSPYVEGILVTNNETGEDLFYFDGEETEMWVAVDRFEGSYDIMNITMTITEEELRSKELMAWLYYKASQLEFDLEKIDWEVEMKYYTVSTGLEKIGFMSSHAPNVPYFESDPGALMQIETPETDEAFIDCVFIPIVMARRDEAGNVKLYPIKAFLRGNFDKPIVFTKWQEYQEAGDYFLIVSHVTGNLVNYKSSLESNIAHSKFEQFHDGDFSALSDSKIIVEITSR